MNKLLAIGIALLCSSDVGGQAKTFRVHYGDDFVPGVEIAAAANAVDKNAKAVGIAFIPDNVRRVRAAIVFVERAVRSEMSVQGRFADAGWRRVAASCECALVFFRVDTVRPIDVETPVDGNVLRNAGAGGGDVLLTLMQRLADESGHAELAGAPFIFWGWSASANFGTTFAERFPARTLAVIRYHTHLREHVANIDALVHTPMLIVAGAKDTAAGVENAETLWRVGLRRGAPWTFVVEPAATHGDEKILLSTQQLMFPWVTAVVAQRFAAGDAALGRLTDDAGWFGNRVTGEIGPMGTRTASMNESTWLPSEAAAKAWQIVSKGSQ